MIDFDFKFIFILTILSCHMKHYCILFLSLILLSCNTGGSESNTSLKYSSSSIEAITAYRKGWVQIMDEGRYGAAEISYRKALQYDSNFLIGKSVLGRLTLDLNERLAFHKELQNNKNKIQGDERLILDVYTALVNYTNLRDQHSSDAKKVIDDALKLAEKNLKKVIHKYPEEIYLKAEYIEILHSLYGPQQALDSITVLTSVSQKNNFFLLGYSASMYAELKNFEAALSQANKLKKIINDTTVPKSYAVLADVYFKMDNLKLAKIHVEKAYQLDPKNIDASRLKEKINQKIKDKTKKD